MRGGAVGPHPNLVSQAEGTREKTPHHILSSRACRGTSNSRERQRGNAPEKRNKVRDSSTPLRSAQNDKVEGRLSNGRPSERRLSADATASARKAKYEVSRQARDDKALILLILLILSVLLPCSISGSSANNPTL